MKKVLIFSLAFIIFFESILPKGIGMEQSFKISELIEHYKTHLAESNGKISFSEFIWLHYNPASKHENPNHNHEKLPHFDSQISFFIFQNAINVFIILNQQSVFYNQAKFIELKSSYLFSFALDFFNPPQ
jgi:hypothetical protein